MGHNEEHDGQQNIERISHFKEKVIISSTTISKTQERIENERNKMQELFSTRYAVNLIKQRSLLESVSILSNTLKI